MIQRVIPSAIAASVPGMIGTQRHAFEAIFDRRGSTTAIFRRPLARPSTIRGARFVGP